MIVIEDNPTDVFLVKEAIAAQQIDVELRVFEDGGEAIALINRLDNSFDPCPALMLLDINLPQVDGFLVLEKLRTSKRCATIPVIVMTSSAAAKDRERSAALGAVDYFQKPSELIAFMKIGEVVRRYLN